MCRVVRVCETGDLGGFPGCGVRGVRDVRCVPVSALLKFE